MARTIAPLKRRGRALVMLGGSEKRGADAISKAAKRRIPCIRAMPGHHQPAVAREVSSLLSGTALAWSIRSSEVLHRCEDGDHQPTFTQLDSGWSGRFSLRA